MFLYLILSLAWTSFSVDASKWARPENFPRGMRLETTRFANWADTIIANNVWTAFPSSPKQVVQVTNWARQNNYTIRASGAMHNWSPLTILPVHNSYHDRKDFFPELLAPNKLVDKLPRVVLLKTQTYLNKFQVINSDPENASFWSEPGVLLDDLLQGLERRKLGFLNVPAAGDITLGGALAIGGHGTGVSTKNETLSKGHSYGSLSNLIIALTAVVYDAELDKYVLKDFKRQDVEAKAFMVHLGRTFITNITMRVGPLQYLRCQSFNHIPVQELLGPDTVKSRTLSKFMEATGRLELIWFPFTPYPWLKVWTVANKKPKSSRLVHLPYNYAFSDRIPISWTMRMGQYARERSRVKFMCPSYLALASAGLGYTDTWDIWGSSRTVLNFIKPTTMAMTAFGVAILTSRRNVQRAVVELYQMYQKRLNSYALRNIYPVNGPLEIRIQGMDNPAEVNVENAQQCGICPSSPIKERPDLDTVIWIDYLTFPRSYKVAKFMADIQDNLHHTFDGTWAIVRVEWSKGFGYSRTNNFPWANNSYLEQMIPSSWTDWEYTRDTLNKYDPFRVFSNEFLNKLFSI